MVSQRPYGLLDEADVSTLIVKIGDLGGGMASFLRCKSCNAKTLNSCPQWGQFFCSRHSQGLEGARAR